MAVSKQTTVFEGFFDQEPGWEFEMPAFMVNPIMGYVEVGSGEAGIDQLIEEYLISRFMKQDENGKAIGDDDEFMCQIDPRDIDYAKKRFRRVKKRRAPRGIFYWKRVIEWDDEDANYQKVLEDVCFSRDGEVRSDVG